MKFKFSVLALSLTSLFMSQAAWAEESTSTTKNTTAVTQADKNEAKHWSLGLGTYALVVDDDESIDEEFTGYTLAATYAFQNNVAVKIQYYNIEHDDFSDVDVSGYDANIYFGTGLLNDGFKAYVGGGLYNETLEIDNLDFDEDFSGLQVSGGIGYNWKRVSLELAMNIRSIEDYEDFYGADDDIIAVSSSLLFSIRF